jgi:hypothetical protein
MSMQDAASLVAAADLVYVSDYFSFVGADARGRVAFAIDNNRGRDGDAYQAEHLYIVLHDERRGWIDLAGVGGYENTKHELLPIPDSPSFQFVGGAAAGLTITSAVNHLTLAIAPMKERVRRADGETLFSLGSTSAVLTWNERVIHGRLIYEYLVRAGYNLMTRRSLKGLAEFQGLYLRAGSDDDLYVHSVRKQHGDGPFGLVGDRVGFFVRGGQPERLDEIHFAATKHALAPGAYRWPTAWRASWQGSDGPASLNVRLATRKRIGNWFVAGFSMGIAAGELAYNGQTIPVYGLAELLMIIGR